MTEVTLLAYERELRAFEMIDIEAATRHMALVRGEYETSFPTLATVVQQVERAERERTAPPRFEVCGRCYSGMVYVDASGNPCDVTESPKRVMRECDCKREWRRQWPAAA